MRFTQWSKPHVATVLAKALKRQVTVDGVDSTVVVDSDGFLLTGKGKRRPQVELRWRDLLSGDAAMAVALNASLVTKRQPAIKPGLRALRRPQPAPDLVDGRLHRLDQSGRVRRRQAARHTQRSLDRRCTRLRTRRHLSNRKIWPISACCSNRTRRKPVKASWRLCRGCARGSTAAARCAANR